MADRQTDIARRHTSNPTVDELLFNRRLGANLRGERLKADITQDELAGQAGMSRGSIANIERGEQTPGLYRLILICSALHIDLEAVLPATQESPQAVAETISDKYSTAVERITRKAQALREDVGSKR